MCQNEMCWHGWWKFCFHHLLPMKVALWQNFATCTPHRTLTVNPICGLLKVLIKESWSLDPVWNLKVTDSESHSVCCWIPCFSTTNALESGDGTAHVVLRRLCHTCTWSHLVFLAQRPPHHVSLKHSNLMLCQSPNLLQHELRRLPVATS